MIKKIFPILIICLVVGSLPATTAFSLPRDLKTPTIVIPESPHSFDNDTPPDWAMGNFSGVWGLNVLGQPLPPAGWVAGYFAFNGLFGRFEGVFDVFNVTNATGAIGGFFLGPFMFGQIVNKSTQNATAFVGLGGANTTHFYWRIMGIIGPTFYMYGMYSKFENTTQAHPFFSLK